MTNKLIKPNVDKSGQDLRRTKDEESMSEEGRVANSGVAGSILNEPVPIYIKAAGDDVWEGLNNTSIVLGRDRYGDRTTGYGGIGDTQAGAIDIVVGRMGDSPKSNVYIDPDFFRDSARIYISQKTNVDANFKLAKGSGNSEGMSAIALKADEIRMISRHGMKLVAGSDTKNSKGSDTSGVSFGIDIIANNDDKELQPMVKGENLRNCLLIFHQEITNLSGIVSTFLASQMEYNAQIAFHFHYSPFFGIPTTPSEALANSGIDTMLKQLKDSLMGLQKLTFNMTSLKTNYLVAPIKGDSSDESSQTLYINSKYNKVN